MNINKQKLSLNSGFGNHDPSSSKNLQSRFMMYASAHWSREGRPVNFYIGIKLRYRTICTVVSTHLKNISQIGPSPQVRVKNKQYLKPPPRRPCEKRNRTSNIMKHHHSQGGGGYQPSDVMGHASWEKQWVVVEPCFEGSKMFCCRKTHHLQISPNSANLQVWRIYSTNGIFVRTLVIFQSNILKLLRWS